jgi:hypothetical protein
VRSHLRDGTSNTWKVVLALVVLGFLLAVGSLAMIPDDPDDDDGGLGMAIGVVANLAG